MFTIIYITILILVLLINKSIFKSTIKINSVFTIIWCFSSILANNNFYGLYTPSNIANWIIISFLIVANLVYHVLHLNAKQYSFFQTTTINRFSDSWLNTKLLLFFNLVSYVFAFPFIRKAAQVIASGGFNALRVLAFEGSSEFASTAQLFIFQWFVLGIFSATIIISSAAIAIPSLAERKKKKTVLLLAIIDAFLYAFLFGGRGILVTLVFDFSIGFLIANKENIAIAIKALFKKKAVVVALVIVVAFAFFLTNSRTSLGGYSALDNFILYYCGSVSFFSETLKFTPWNAHLYWGKCTFGFLQCIFEAAKFVLFGSEYMGADVLVSNLLADPLIIGEKVAYNALATTIYPFMMDFSYFGIAIGAILFGFLFYRAEVKFYKSNNLYAYCFFIFIYSQLALNGIRNYPFYKVSPLVTIIVIFCVTKIRFGGKASNGRY